MTAPRMLVNGRPGDQVSASDRGFLYGDGLFETLAVHAGRAVAFAAHWQRLSAGCERLGLDCPGSEQLEDEILRVCSGLPRAVGKIILTRGSGARGYAPDSGGRALRVVAAFPWPDGLAKKHAQGVAVKLLRQHLGSQGALAGLKHLSRLEQVYAAGELAGSGFDEGLLCDTDGRLIEAVQSNLFLVKSGTLLTPSLAHAGVAGVMRERIMVAAEALGLQVRVEALAATMLGSCEEMFLSNSIAGVVPVNRVNERLLEVGPVTLRLQSELHEDWRT